MSFWRALVRSPQVGAALAAAVLVTGCGNNYRPVVAPINSNGPPAQPESYAIVVSSTGPSTPGVGAIVDYSGDSILAEAPLGVGAGPISMTIDESGFIGTRSIATARSPISLSPHCPASTEKPDLNHIAFDGASREYVCSFYGDLDWRSKRQCRRYFQGQPGNVPTLGSCGQRHIPAPTPVFIAGSPSSTGQRNYVISEGFTDKPAWPAITRPPRRRPMESSHPSRLPLFPPTFRSCSILRTRPTPLPAP